MIEEMRSQFKVFGEAVLGVRQDLAGFREEVTSRFERVDREMALGFARVDREMAEGLGRIDRDLELVKSAIVDHSRELRDLRGEVGELRGEVGELRGAVNKVEAVLEKKVERDEVEAIVRRVATPPRSR
ncbi:MAG: hypothetical protein ACLQVI_24030 [Polyangiaceae bacterium]